MKTQTIFATVGVIIVLAVAAVLLSPKSISPVHVPPSEPIAFNTPVTIELHKTVVFPDGLQVNLFRIDDSRCKPGVQCIWAGELKGVLHLTVQGVSLSSEVELGEITSKTKVLGQYTFTLEGATETSITIRVTNNASATVGSGVKGRVLLSPTCPVERVPADPKCAPKGYATDIAIFQKGNNFPATTVKSDSTGAYFAALTPGTYLLKTSGGQVLPRCENVEVTVMVGQVAIADISCDTGIR